MKSFFVFECQIPDLSLADEDELSFQDGAVDNTAKWVDLDHINENLDQLFPNQLANILNLH